MGMALLWDSFGVVAKHIQTERKTILLIVPSLHSPPLTKCMNIQVSDALKLQPLFGHTQVLTCLRKSAQLESSSMSELCPCGSGMVVGTFSLDLQLRTVLVDDVRKGDGCCAILHLGMWGQEPNIAPIRALPSLSGQESAIFDP